MLSMIEVKNVSNISKNYDCFFIDLWGVVHNGVHIFDGVQDTLNYLKKKNKLIYFITNAPRRSEIIKNQLSTFGLKRSLYDDVVSSGEVTWQKMKNKKKLKCYLIGPPRDYHLVEGLNVDITENTDGVEVIINTGPWGDGDKLDNYKSILKELRKSNPVMICSNPDKTVVRGNKFMICAGLLAEYYEKIGGKVEYYGKPFSEIYEFTFEKLKNPNAKILVIGDSLDNDIKGANMQQIDSLLITSGIHRSVNNDCGIDKRKLNDLIKKKKIKPSYYMKSLII